MDPSSFQVLFNTLHPPEDHSFIPGAMGGKIPGFVYGQSQPGPSSSSVQDTSIDALGGIIPAPNFDPAQFIWAVSNQLPQIEDSSPYDERTGTFSGGSGPSPHLGDLTSRHGNGKGKEKEIDGEGSKLVKITWWRPHGAVRLFFNMDQDFCTDAPRRPLHLVSSSTADMESEFQLTRQV